MLDMALTRNTMASANATLPRPSVGCRRGPGKGQHGAGDNPPERQGQRHPPKHRGLGQSQGPCHIFLVFIHFFKRGPGRLINQGKGDQGRGQDRALPGKHQGDAEDFV